MTLLAAVLLTGCSNSPEPQPSSSTSAPSTTTPPVTTSQAPTTPAAPPTYTSPPSRGVTRPPGVRPVKDVPCSRAVSDAQFYAAGWFGGVASYVQDGEPVPDFQWADAVTSLPKISGAGGVAMARANLRADGVPTSYVAFKDLADLESAMRTGNNAAKARDESKALGVYFAVLTAKDHLVESCGALEK
jgi:hypothetical protein